MTRHPDSEALFAIGALSRASGVNTETIRYYERVGIVPPPPRTAGGYRQYDTGQLRRLRFVKRSRELGFSLDEVRTLLDLVDGGGTCTEIRELTLSHLAEIRAKIADLRRMEIVLAETSDRCAGGEVPDCPIIDILSE